MGNKVTHQSLTFDRVIDGDSGIYVGVNGFQDPDYPMSKQKLLIQDENQYRKLKFFTKTESGLTYEFEDNVILRFYKNNDGVYYNLKHPNKKIDETKLMNKTVREWYKKIEFNSNELDQIYDLINQKK